MAVTPEPGRKCAGFSFVELMIALLITSLITVGLIFGVVSTSYHTKDDQMLLELREYCYLALNELEKDLRNYGTVTLDQLNGFSRITLVCDFDRLVWKLEEEEGFIRDEEPLFEEWLLVPSGDERREVIFESFDVVRRIEIDPTLQPLSRNTYDIELKLILRTALGGDYREEEIRVTRSIFHHNGLLQRC